MLFGVGLKAYTVSGPDLACWLHVERLPPQSSNQAFTELRPLSLEYVRVRLSLKLAIVSRLCLLAERHLWCGPYLP